MRQRTQTERGLPGEGIRWEEMQSLDKTAMLKAARAWGSEAPRSSGPFWKVSASSQDTRGM